MRSHLIIFLLTFLGGCGTLGDRGKLQDDEAPAGIIKVDLNTHGGYQVNPHNGNKVLPIINSEGQPVRTGQEIRIDSGSFRRINTVLRSSVKAGPGEKMQADSFIHALPANIPTSFLDLSALPQDQYRAGSPVSADIQFMDPVSPRRLKALPTRFKDNVTFNMQYLDVAQGLTSSYAYSVLEDKRGNMWFGTDGTGVCMYNGQYVLNYDQKQGLSGRVVNCMLQDSKGNLWFGTEHGITGYNGDQFFQFRKNKALDESEIHDIIEDKKGRIWFATSNHGVLAFDGKDIIQITKKEGLIHNNVLSIMEDKEGRLWFGTDSGISVFNGKAFTGLTKKDGITGKGVFNMLQSRNGMIWICTLGGGVYSYDGQRLRNYTTEQGLTSNYIWDLLEDSDGNIWISSYVGLTKFDGSHFSHYSIPGVNNMGVRRMAEDHMGNIWFGTDGNGIGKLYDRSFIHMPSSGMFSRKVRSILEDRNKVLWFGTNGNGLIRYQGNSLTRYTTADGINNDGIRSLLEDKKGNIWMGHDGFGMTKYDGSRFTRYLLDNASYLDYIRAIIEDSIGTMWVGAFGAGLIHFDGERFSLLTDRNGLSHNKVTALLYDSKGNIWIGSEGGGLSRYDGKSMIHFSEKEGLPSNKVFCLYEDRKGNIWIGTWGGGVCKFDGKTFYGINESNGLSNDNVWSIIEDHKGQFWFGTDNGLTKAVPNGNEYTFYRYGLEDGLKAADFNLKTVLEDDQKRLWWGTGKSLMYLDQEKARARNDSISVAFDFIEINGREYDFRNFPDSLRDDIEFSTVPAFSSYPEKLRLAHFMNHLVFHFVAADWIAPQNTRYEYRLRGQDEHWSRPGSSGMAEYRNLGYGDYIFEVRAMGRSGAWSPVIRYSFTVLPAWWQTWWFRLLELLVAIAIIYFVTRYVYINQLRKQRGLMEKQLAVQLERQRISSEMHDDIGAGISGVRLLAEMAIKKVKDEDERTELFRINQYLGAISARMKEVIWSLNVENDDIGSLISFLQKQARQLMEAYPGEFSVSIPNKIPEIEIDGESRRNIYLLVKEALHNIIKHSGASKASLQIEINQGLHITIRDNGQGFVYPPTSKTGNGLKNMNIRMESLKGDMQVIVNGGTTIILNIPLTQRK